MQAESNNIVAKGNSPYLEADVVSSRDHHAASEPHTEEGEGPLLGDEAVHHARHAAHHRRRDADVEGLAPRLQVRVVTCSKMYNCTG